MYWLPAQMALLDAARAVVSFAANWLLQSTLLIAAGLAVARLARCRGSALQSAIYRTTLAAVVVCPLATLLLSWNGVSGWSLRIPVAWEYEDLPSAARGVVARPPAPETPDDFAGMDAGWDERVEPAPAHHGEIERQRERGSEREEYTSSVSPSLPLSVPNGGPPLANSLAPPYEQPQPATSERESTLLRVRAFGWLAAGMALTWLLVSAIRLARLAFAWRQLDRLCTTAVPAETTVQQMCAEVASLLGVVAPKVLSSPYLASPCLAYLWCGRLARSKRDRRDACTTTASRRDAYTTTASRRDAYTTTPRAVVLLPEVSPALPLRDVLVHELAHLRRGDAGWNLVARLVEVLFFYQPLVWLLARRLEASAEDVCDDYVVQFGGDRSQYARGLLEIAELSTTPVAATAVAMVSLRSILARRVTRIMDSSRSLSTRAGNLLLIVVIIGGLIGTMAAGFVGLGSQHSLAEVPATAEKVANSADEQSDDEQAGDVKLREAPQAKPEDAQAALEKRGASEEKRYHGKVVAADGRASVGAEIWFAVSPYDHVASTVQGTLRRVAVSDSRGDFSFRLKPPENADQFPVEWTKVATLVAKAPHHGFDWLPLAVFESSPVASEERAELERNVDEHVGTGRFAGRTLMLPREAGPVRGRLLDLEGRPLNGVAVSVESIQSPDMAMLRQGMEEASRDVVNRSIWTRAVPGSLDGRIWQALIPPVKTNDDGEFALPGLGRDQVATVTLSGERVEAERFLIVGTEMETKRVPHISFYPKGAQDSFVGVDFSLAIGPAIPVSGVVSEFKTGKPIAGATVFVERLFSRESIDGSQVQLRLNTSHIRAVTDEQGRYRLVGIPPGERHRLNAIPPKSQPWLIASQTISLDPGQSSATVNIQVFRGIWIEGKVTDANTGEAIKGRVDYLALKTNKNIPQEFGLEDGWEMGRFPIGAEGRYRTAGLPGPGVLFVRSSGKKVYPLGVGAEKIEGYDAEGSYLPTTPTGYPLSNWNLLQFIDPSVGVGSYRCDLTLSAGGSLAGRIVGPNGAPGASIEAMGLVEKNGFFEPLKDDKFTATDYRPDVPRNLFFRTTDQSLIGYLHLEGKPPADLTIRLQPSVTVRGRLIETETEDPAAGYELYCDSSKQGEFRIADTPTDKEGRFEIKGLMAGNVYKMDSGNVQRFVSQKNGFTIDLTHAKPGDIVDLDDVTGKNAKRIPAAPDQSDSSDDKKTSSSDRPGDAKTLRGRVLLPDGKPAAGAAVALRVAIHDADDPPLGSAVTDAAGRFEFSFHWPQFDERTGAQPDLIVVATADNLAPDWKYLRNDEPPGDIALNLLEEKTISGRIVNEEGRPLAGVELRVETIVRYDDETKKRVVDDVAEGRALLRMGKSWHFGALPKQRAIVITAADGRFRIGRLSSNTVARLHLRGAGIRETRLNATTAVAETIRGPVPPVEPPYGPRAGMVLYGSQFDYVAEPGRRIQGTVRDRETGMPVARAKVMIYQPTAAVGGGYEVTAGVGNDRLSAETDEAGHYAIDGCAKNSRVGLNVDPPADGPAYFPAALPVEDTPGLAEVTQNVELVRGIELRGRIVDSETGQPLIASLQYAPLYLNKFAASLYEQEANLRSHTRSDADGSFRLAVAPGPGAVAVSRPTAAPEDYTNIRVSYEDVVKLFEASPSHREFAHSPDLKLGLPDSFRTQERGGWSLISQSGEARMILVCPEEQKPPEPVEVRLVRGRRIRGKVIDPDGQPLAGARAYLNNPGIGYKSLSTAEFTVSALAPGEKRDIAFQHDERRLGAFRTISADETEPLIVALEPCASARGRVLDEQGAPIAGLHVWFYRVGPITSEASFAVTDAEGRFRIEKLIPQQPYEVMRSGPGSMSYRQFSPQKLIFSVASGNTYELGDLVVKGPVQTVSQTNPTASAAEDGDPPNGKKPGNSAALVESRPNRADNAKDASSDQPAKEKIVRGRVLLADGKPARGAHVAVIGHRTAVTRGADLDWGHEVLAEAAADENGNYILRMRGVSQKTHNYPRVIARRDGSVIAWREINLDAAEMQADFDLKPEEPLRGNLVDLEGEPAAGVRLSIASVVERRENEEDGYGVGYRARNKIPAVWISPITSDEQGRFVVHGLAASQGATLEAQGNDRFARQEIALNTGMPEERGEHDGTYRPLVKNAKPGEEVVLALAPAQVFEGTVRYADTGEPAPHARVSIWASQQELGTMIALAATADEQGRYHITPWAGIRFGLTAYPPAGTPYLARTLSEPIHWEGSERLKKVDMTLPRGVLVRGTVVEAGSGAPVAGAAVQYEPESTNNRNASDRILTGSQCREVTDDDGRFAIAVLPGSGRLLVNGPKGEYVLREIGDREVYAGKPGGTRYYVHAFAKLNPEAGHDAVEVKLELQPGATVKGRIVDDAGKEVDEALVISRLNIWQQSPFWRGHTTPTLGGGFELTGLAEGVEYPIYFLDQKRRLGATVVIKAGDKERTVVLRPCGKVTFRMIDDKGESVPANYGFTEMVVTPGAARYDRDAIERGELVADGDFVANIDRMNNLNLQSEDSGERTLKALIPGATYRIIAKRDGQIKAVKEFQVKPNETLDFGDMIVER